MIMMARIMPAVMKLRPLHRPPNSVAEDGMPPMASAIDVVDRLDVRAPSTQDAPQAEHHRRDGGQQVDHVDDRLAEPPLGHLGEEQGDAEADRHREDQGDDRRQQRAVDEGQRAELVLASGSSRRR